MFELYEKVRIKDKEIVGTILDISGSSDDPIITVESDTKGYRDDGYGGIWPLFDCKENELEKVTT